MPEQDVYLTDSQMEKVQKYATEQGLTNDQAASQMVDDALAARYHRPSKRTTAKIYQLPKRPA